MPSEFHRTLSNESRPLLSRGIVNRLMGSDCCVRSFGFGHIADGRHHHTSARYLYQYAAEAAWKKNDRRLSNGDAFRRTARLALALPVSRHWKDYWERSEG